MTVRFEHPVWLILLVLAIPTAYTALRWFASMSLVRRASAAVFRVVLIALITGMLAGATAVRTTEKLAVIAVVDISGSVQRFASKGSSVLDRVRAFIRDASKNGRADDLLGVVVFDGESAAVLAPTRVRELDLPLDMPMSEGTNVEQALRLAAAMVPPDAAARIVLFSDGVETDGDARRAASELATRAGGSAVTSADATAASGARRTSTPIDIVPIAYNVTREVFIESVDAPSVAPEGALVTVRVVLQAAGDPAASGGVSSRGTLELLHEGRPLDINADLPGTGRQLSLPPGHHVELITTRLPQGRLHRFEALFVPDGGSSSGASPASSTPASIAAATLNDTITTNNRAQAFTFTPGSGSILVVRGVPASTSPSATESTLDTALPDTLRDGGMNVVVVTPDAVPSDPLALQAFDLVVLANVPADALPKRTQDVLAGYVKEQGGGLVMLGGHESFGAGGWKGTEIEPILPVLLDLPEKLIVPAVAIVFVLDNSGSMGRRVMGSSRTQQFIANEGAAIALRSLSKTDLVGVVTFNNRADVLVPLAPNTEPDRAAEAIRSIRSDGGTNIPPALIEAGRQLSQVTADFKHVILLTDGRSQSKESLPGIADSLREQGIHITTIGVGDDCDEPMLKTVANRGGGIFYPVTDPTTLPRVFVKAVRVVRSPLVRESPFTPQVVASGSPLVEHLPSALPPLGGISLTQARPDPLVTTAMLHPAGEPLLAHWNVGLGRVAAFTSSADNWSREWIPTPIYKEFWTDLARLISRPPSDRSQELTIEPVGSDLHIRLDATGEGGKPLDLLSVPGSLYTPSGERIPIKMSQTGPGQYEATVRAPASGNHVVTLTPRLGSKSLPPIVGGIARASGVEYRRLRSNVGLLEELARSTGGRVLDLDHAETANLFDRSDLKPVEARRPLASALLLWTLIVLLLDIGTRRIAWDRFVSREFGAAFKAEARAAMESRAKQTQVVLGKLKNVEPNIEAGKADDPKPAALGSDDAREIVRAQAERRRAARDAKRAEQRAAADAAQAEKKSSEAASGGEIPTAPKPSRAGDAPAASEEEPKGADVDEAAAPDEGGGLFAAKKRARDRMKRDEQT